MKAYTLAAGVILAAATAMGQQQTNERPYLTSTVSYSDINLPKAARSFLSSLNSSNDGVVESAIAQVAYMRAALPMAELTDIERTVNELANTGRTPAIRYKAYLASLVFSNPTMFRNDTSVDYASGDEFFNALSVRLQQTLLGYNSR